MSNTTVAHYFPFRRVKVVRQSVSEDASMSCGAGNAVKKPKQSTSTHAEQSGICLWLPQRCFSTFIIGRSRVLAVNGSALNTMILLNPMPV